MSIIGMHALIYSNKADETRRFFSDVLGFRSVDVGRGWLIFAAPPSELAVHPADQTEHHELYLMCDNIEKTISELRQRGVETSAIHDQPWGRVTQMKLPSGQELGMYEPRHPTAIGWQPRTNTDRG
jgi:predicted enzyme related to lactoylglutathione lyase